MSRRKPDTRSAKEIRDWNEWDTVEILCSGRGTHSREVFGEVNVETVAARRLSDSELGGISTDKLLETYVHGMEDAAGLSSFLVHDVEDELGGHITRTLRCRKCGRNLSFREGDLARRIVALVRAGGSRIDLSRLDRVRLS